MIGLLAKHTAGLSLAGRAGFVALALTTVVVCQANALTLRDSVVTTTDVVTVGDFFADAAVGADTALFRSPAVGKSGMVSAERLRLALDGIGLDWSPPHDVMRVQVRRIAARSGTRLDRDTLIGAIRSEIVATLPEIASADDVTVTFAANTDDIRLPGRGAADVMVQSLEVMPRRRRFAAVVEIVQGGHRQSQTVSGRYQPTPRVPVLVQPITRGTVVTADLVTWTRIDDRTPNRPMLRSMDTVLGQAARRQLRAGEPLRPGDLEAPKVIARNQLVTITFRMAGMTLTTQGRSLGSAALGEAVSVINLRSNRIIQAVAAGEGRAEVGPTQQTLLAQR